LLIAACIGLSSVSLVLSIFAVCKKRPQLASVPVAISQGPNQAAVAIPVKLLQ
jgi:hypothetical protein